MATNPFAGTGIVPPPPPPPPAVVFDPFAVPATAMVPMPGMPMSTGRPACGGGGVQGEYDLPLHVIALFLVLGASLFGAGFPVVAKKFKNLKIPPKVFFFCKHFGTGVLIATAFVHLLPTAFASLNDPCLPPLFTEKYPPLPGAIMLLSLFSLFCIELWLNQKTGGHSHGGATGEGIVGVGNNHGQIHAHGHDHHERAMVPKRPKTPETFWEDDKKSFSKDSDSFSELSFFENNPGIESEMPPWFVAFYEQYVRQRDEMYAMVSRNMPRLPAYAQQEKQTSVTTTEVSKFDDEDDLEAAVDPMVLRRMSLNITMLEGGILFHSVFVGMTVSITVEGFVVLLIAILFHQTFEGLGLGSRIAAVPYPKGSIKPWLLVFAFGTTAPIGQAIGLIARQSYDPNSAFALIIVGTFNAISSGLLIYAALVDLLQQDFLSEEANMTMTMKDKIHALIYVLMGAAGMATVGAFA